jgi:hypothetical protein
MHRNHHSHASRPVLAVAIASLLFSAFLSVPLQTAFAAAKAKPVAPPVQAPQLLLDGSAAGQALLKICSAEGH